MAAKIDNHRVVESIRTIRLIRGIKTESMARQLGISKSTYSDIETGKSEITLSRLQKIADILRVNYTIILDPAFSVEGFLPVADSNNSSSAQINL